MATNDYIAVNKAQFRKLEKWFKESPKEIKKAIKKEWRKESMVLIRKIRKERMTTRGADSVQYRGGAKKIKRKNNRVPLRTSFRVRKLKFSVRKSFGGFIVIGYYGSRREPRGSHHIGFFHEFGTENMPARELIGKGWEDNSMNMEHATENALDRVVRTF